MLELKLIRARAGKCISDPPIKFNENAWINRLKKRITRTRAFDIQEEIVSDLSELKKQSKAKEVSGSLDTVDLPISMMQLLAVRAIRDGIDKDPLMANVNAIFGLCQHNVIKPWINVHGLRRQISKNLPRLIDNALLGGPTPWSSMDLIKFFYPEEIKPSKTILNDFNLLLNMLTTTGNVVHLPSNSKLGHNVSMWIHNSRRWTEASIPTWNLKFAILRALHGTELTKMQLVAAKQVSELAAGKRSSITHKIWRTLESPLNGLREQSLIMVGKDDTTLKPGAKPTIYKLTEKAKVFFAIMEEKRYLPEGLRIALLGQKKTGLKPNEEDTLMKMVRCIRALMAIEAFDPNKANVIAKRIGENISYVNSLIHTPSRPWNQMSKTNLKQKYLPTMKEIFPEFAEWFEDYLKNEIQPSLFDHIAEDEPTNPGKSDLRE